MYKQQSLQDKALSKKIKDVKSYTVIVEHTLKFLLFIFFQHKNGMPSIFLIFAGIVYPKSFIYLQIFVSMYKYSS